MNRTKAGVGVAAIGGMVGSGYILWFSFADRDYLWVICALFYAVAVLIAAWRLWQGNVWGLRLSWLLAAVGLGFGIYVAQFRWNFWLFQTPTLKDRILSLFHPTVLLYVGGPLLWLMVSTRSKFRSSL
jgi:hypothetical protein